MSEFPQHIAIVGTGALGKSLMVQSVPHFKKVWILSRSNTTFLKLNTQEAIPVAIDETIPKDWNPSWVFLCVPDDAIVDTAQKLKDELWLTSVKAVIHTSGAHASGILKDTLPESISIGSWHPLQTFPADAWLHSNPFEKAVVSFEGNSNLFDDLKIFTQKMDAQLEHVTEEEKLLLHLSAVMLSNFLIPFMRKGLSVLSDERIKTHGKGMEQLMHTTIRNVLEKGALNSLSGPAFRGDEQTLTRHENLLKALSDKQLLEFYKRMTNEIKEMVTSSKYKA